MRNERIEITRPGTFDECGSCEILENQIKSAKAIDTHRGLNCPFDVREIHIRCLETGYKLKKDEVPNVNMSIHVQGVVLSKESEQIMSFVDNLRFIECPHYHSNE